ncbi:MAG: hypothetical protein ACPG45_10725 [Flavobacteriaceae bacterium]
MKIKIKKTELERYSNALHSAMVDVHTKVEALIHKSSHDIAEPESIKYDTKILADLSELYEIFHAKKA